MSKLSIVYSVQLPIDCVKDMYRHLRSCGQHKLEGVALLAGVQRAHDFVVKTIVIPAQTGYRMEEGLLYAVEGEELHRVNTWLYQNKMTLIGQVHSHPSEAYHSDTDNRYPIVATYGALSIVIPDFAFGPFNLNAWAVYRLFSTAGWQELKVEEVHDLIKITY